MGLFVIPLFILLIALIVFLGYRKKKKGKDEYRDTPPAPGEAGSASDQEKS